MRNPLMSQRLMGATEPDEPAKFCFRYRSKGRHHRLYDVLMTLDDAGEVCHVEVYHALPEGDDFPPLAAGHLDAARLTRAIDLIGLVERVASHDHTMRQPGRLVLDLHMQMPSLPIANVPDTGTRRSARSSSAHHALAQLETRQTVYAAPVTGSAAGPEAHARIRYPLHGLGRTTRVKHQGRNG